VILSLLLAIVSLNKIRDAIAAFGDSITFRNCDAIAAFGDSITFRNCDAIAAFGDSITFKYRRKQCQTQNMS
jgi:hypothetical protein